MHSFLKKNGEEKNMSTWPYQRVSCSRCSFCISVACLYRFSIRYVPRLTTSVCSLAPPVRDQSALGRLHLLSGSCVSVCACRWRRSLVAVVERYLSYPYPHSLILEMSRQWSLGKWMLPNRYWDHNLGHRLYSKARCQLPNSPCLVLKKKFTVPITSNLRAHTWSIKCSWKK